MTEEEQEIEIKINLDSLPEATRNYILELSTSKNISPNEAATLVLNYTASTQTAA